MLLRVRRGGQGRRSAGSGRRALPGAGSGCEARDEYRARPDPPLLLTPDRGRQRRVGRRRAM